MVDPDDAGAMLRHTRPRLNLLEKDHVLWMLASICQTVHDFLDDLEAADPACASLVHMNAHGIDQEMVNETKDDQLRLLDELIMTRAVDMFGIYLSEMLLLVFKQQPRILRSGSQMRIDEILEHDSMDQLLGEITRRKVDDLSARGFFSIVAFIKEKLGVDLNLPEKTLVGVTEAIAVRNIIVHNDGRVNERFMTLTSRTDLHSGSVYPFSPFEVKAWGADLERAANIIDTALVKKFHIETYVPAPHLRCLDQDDDPIPELN